jgi:hypothetical protein
MDALSATIGPSSGECRVKTIAHAAKPFYGSLDDTQKHKFGLLGRDMIMASGPMWEELGGDAGGTWVPGHWME